MKSLRSQVRDLSYELGAEVEHGECFYDKEMLDSFLDDLNRMKNLAVALYKENEAKD